MGKAVQNPAVGAAGFWRGDLRAKDTMEMVIYLGMNRCACQKPLCTRMAVTGQVVLRLRVCRNAACHGLFGICSRCDRGHGYCSAACRGEARRGIVGMGYVGLPLALLFSAERLRVTGFDITETKVNTLNSGGSYIVRIPPEAIQRAQRAGFHATSDYAEVASMDAVIICVPTPLDEYHEPDLSFVTGTVKSIAPYIREGQLIALESTTYPGTTEEVVVPLLEKGNPHGLKVARAAGEFGFHVASSPEREDPGNDAVKRHDIPKVVGGCDPEPSNSRRPCILPSSAVWYQSAAR